MTCSRSCDQEKITETIEIQPGLRKTRFFWKNNPPACLFLFRFFFFFKRTGFVLLKKHENPKRKFSCVLYAHSQLLCSLASFKLSTLSVRHPRRIHSDRLLFDETFTQPCIFAVVNCADVALSVFYSPVLTRCLILLQSWTALSWETAIIYVHYSDTL